MHFTHLNTKNRPIINKINVFSVHCPPLSNPANGYYTSTQGVSKGRKLRNVDSSRIVHCNCGYRAAVTNTTCLINGSWSLPIPACDLSNEILPAHRFN